MDGNCSSLSDELEHSDYYLQSPHQMDGNYSLNSAELGYSDDCQDSPEYNLTVQYLDENYPNIIQLDGNVSLGLLTISDESLVTCPDVNVNNSYIDVITGNRPAQVKREKRNPVLKRIKRKNTGELSLFLPKVAVYNHRSIWKKIRNFATEFHELKMGLALHSEVWERKEKRLTGIK